MRHVVSVSDESQLVPPEVGAKLLLQSEHVCKSLARMIKIAQGIDDWNARPGSQIVDSLLCKGTCDYTVGPPVQIACNVFKGLAIPDHTIGRHDIATELLDSQLEGDACSQ